MWGVTVHGEGGEWLKTRSAEVRSGQGAGVRTLAFTLGETGTRNQGGSGQRDLALLPLAARGES